MQNSVKKEAKLMANHAIVYGLGTFLNRIVGFLMIPIYTKFLTPGDYGVLEIVTLTIEIIAMVASAGMTQSVSRFYFKYEKNQDRNEVLSTSIIAFSLLSLVVLIPVVLAAPYLSNLLLDRADQKSIFIVGIINIWFASLAQVGFLYLRILKKSLLFLQFSAMKLVMALLLNIYFVVVLKVGVIGILYSTLISSMIMASIMVTPILKETGFLFSRKKFEKLFRYGAPMIPASIANFSVLVSDKFFLRFLTSLADTGLYSLATRFAVIPGHLIVYPFMQIWDVRRFEIHNQPNSEEIMGRVFTYFCLVLTFVGLAVSILSRDAIELMANPSFWPAYRVVPILVLSQIIYSFNEFFSFGIMINQKTKYFAYIDIFNALTNFILNYFLIKKFGMLGAAYATLASYSIRVIIVYIVTIPLYQFYFEANRVGKIFLSAGFIYWLGSILHTESTWGNLAAKLLLLFFFPGVLAILFFFKSGEIEIMKQILKTRKLPQLFHKL